MKNEEKNKETGRENKRSTHLPDHTYPKTIITKTKQIITLIILTVTIINAPRLYAQEKDSIIYRDVTIELDNGLTTQAQITIPKNSEGPFPGVLLVPGSGASDMNEFIFQGTATGEPIRPLLQIAEYLTEKGYMVLRYNKRGVETDYIELDYDVLLNLTYPQLLNDLERALEALRSQPEVDESNISIIGHSEGAYLCALTASRDPSISKVVLLGVANHAHDLAYWQKVELKLRYANAIDLDKDGYLSVQEVANTLGTDTFLTINPEALIANISDSWEWNPGVDLDEDGLFSTESELKPLLLQTYQAVMTMEYPGSKLIQSGYEVETVLDTINRTKASILLLHGEDDIIAPVSEAIRIEEKLDSSNHNDFLLIKYSGLSHYFYDSDGYSMAIGPIKERVLEDMYNWLSDPKRNDANLTPSSSGDEPGNQGLIIPDTVIAMVLVVIVASIWFFRPSNKPTRV